MPMMEDLLARLQESPPQTEEDLRGMLSDTGYDLVPSEPGMEEEFPGDEGPEEDIAVEEEFAPEGGEEIEEEVEEGPLGLPPLPAAEGPEGRPSEAPNPRMRMKMLVMDASKKALKGKKGGK